MMIQISSFAKKALEQFPEFVVSARDSVNQARFYQQSVIDILHFMPAVVVVISR